MKRRLSSERQKRSWVWKYFELDHTKINGKDKSNKWVKCVVPDCKNPSLKMAKSNTSNMAHHLIHDHKIFKDVNDASEEEEEEEVLIPFSKTDQDLIDVKLYDKFLLSFQYYFLFTFFSE
jgi:hypothetical protein